MVALTEMADYSLEDGIAVITIDNPPVNALSQGVRQGLKDGIAKVELALVRGRKRYDKRAVIAKRDADREIARALRRRQ